MICIQTFKRIPISELRFYVILKSLNIFLLEKWSSKHKTLIRKMPILRESFGKQKVLKCVSCKTNSKALKYYIVAYRNYTCLLWVLISNFSYKRSMECGKRGWPCFFLILHYTNEVRKKLISVSLWNKCFEFCPFWSAVPSSITQFLFLKMMYLHFHFYMPHIILCSHPYQVVSSGSINFFFWLVRFYW